MAEGRVGESSSVVGWCKGKTSEKMVAAGAARGAVAGEEDRHNLTKRSLKNLTRKIEVKWGRERQDANLKKQVLPFSKALFTVFSEL